MDDVAELDFRRHADDLRQTWQGRILRETNRMVGLGVVEPNGEMGDVLLSVLAHSFDEAMPVLMRVVFPGFQTIGTPFICSAAKIDKAGRIVADVIGRRDIAPRKDLALFRSMRELQGKFRRLADRMKLTDQERLELFAAVKRWVVADRRLDPTMDANDPDARRLTVH